MSLFEHLKKNNKIKLFFTIYLILWMVFIVVGFSVLDQYNKKSLAAESNAAYHSFIDIINKYDDVLIKFDVYINQDTLEDFDLTEFNIIAEDVFLEDFGITALAYAPAAEIGYVYPSLNTYLSVDEDLFEGITNAEREALQDSILSGENVFLFEDSDSFQVLKIYKPLFIDDNFHGFAIIVIDTQLITAEMIEFGRNTFGIVIFTEDNEVIINLEDVSISDLTIFPIEESPYALRFGLYPKEVYENRILFSMVLYLSTVTLVFIGILAYTTYSSIKTSNLLETLNYKSRYDDKFNIYNYQKMQSDIEQLIKENEEFHFAFGNINNLKYMFNKFGHNVGDKLLQNVIDNIQSVLSDNTKLYRYGGDEFVLIIVSAEQFEVKNILQRVLRLFDSEIVSGKIRGNLSISLGVVNYPKQADNIDDLINKADVTMSTTKSFNKNSFEFYKTDIVKNFIHNQDIDTYLSSIPIDKFDIYLMPIVSVEDEKIRGFECLARLFDENGNLLNIPEIIGSLERNGRIQELDEYVFKRTCEYKVKLDTMFSENYFLSTNVSGLSFNEKYVNNIIDTFEHYDNLKNNIIVELTESYRFDDVEFLFKLFNKMTSANIKLAMDDFGSGFSSLQSLSKTPLDIIKIDKSFIQGIGDNLFNKQLVRMVQGFSETLNVEVVVEGVDSIDQVEFVKEVGCKYYQGFYYSQAIDFDGIVKLIKKEKIKFKRGANYEK